MQSLRKVAVLAVGLGVSVSVSAFADWITMYGDHSYNTRYVSSSFRTCKYSTSPGGSGEVIFIRVSSSICPPFIEYNPEMNSWRE
ncbi:hypothetical protein [Actinobacillus arthritidis]|uniref:hypothetical protein n=1 Tax=Actinobacillus arthritidis TaxID=157339 RepID=UPI0024417EFD|nr:hypothetical protein [Actinobacillus arthritidis]WGE88667.1 hypothetical protein NYR89_05900 [Actinobacillus arthritidis]